MGMLFGGGAPKPPPIPALPPIANPSTAADPAVQNAGANNRARSAAAAAGGTVGAQGAQGLTTPLSTAKSTLLGGASV